MLSMCCLIAALSASSARAADVLPAGTSAGGAQDESLTEVNKKLSNPVSEIWSISFQQNNYRLSTIPGREDKWSSNLNFQPVLPVSLTENWNLIIRPVLPLFVSQPHPVASPGSPAGMDIERTTGFGDSIFMEMLAPTQKLTGNWLFGIGPTFIFPTASTDFTGQGKWQVGPAAVAGYLSQKWILGVGGRTRVSTKEGWK